MGFGIFEFLDYSVLNFLFLLLYSASASALHVSRMVEKNNNHRARHYVPETEKLELLRTLKVSNRGKKPKKKHIYSSAHVYSAVYSSAHAYSARRGAPRKVSARDFSKSAARALCNARAIAALL